MSTKLKLVKIGSGARNELIKGANFLADAVKATLGPFGSNFYIEKGSRITNDGVTIAREIELKDEIQNRGVVALREASIKTNDEVGDGTTSAIVLAQAILDEATRRLGDDERGIKGKMTPVEVIKKIEEERKEITEKLISMSTKIESREAMIHSAKVSVEDDELAELIGGAQWELGPEGIIIAEETAERKSSIEKVKGIKIDNGFGTSVIINNHEKQSLEVNDTSVILTNYVLKDLNPVKKIIDQLVKAGIRNVVIVARAFTSECIQVCLQNINQGAIKIYPVNAPYTDMNEVMKDLATILGGTYYFDEEYRLEDMQLSDVGYADKVIAKRYEALITGKDNDVTKERVIKRVAELNTKLSGEVSEFEKRNLQKRIAQLTNGFAIVKIGATSETERKYKKDKADDAVNAVRVALQEGVVDGAGLAFKTISESLPDSYLLKRPLLSINEQIMYTAPKGFTIEKWVKDPVKVLRVALEKACSISSTLATVCGATATQRDPVRYMVDAKDNNEEEENG